MSVLVKNQGGSLKKIEWESALVKNQGEKGHPELGASGVGGWLYQGMK